jgi:hypothetical protein
MGGYEYIIGARIRNESEAIKSMIFSNTFTDGKTVSITKNNCTRLIINYSDKRAAKDAYNRKRGLKRLENQIKRGRLTKANINQRGYNIIHDKDSWLVYDVFLLRWLEYNIKI